jgi:predicted regulator of Ras-like GTPase activity (Roadblock/LC7/MglB family)
MNIKDNTTTTFVICESSMNTTKGFNKHMKISKIENLNYRYEKGKILMKLLNNDKVDELLNNNKVNLCRIKTQHTT